MWPFCFVLVGVREWERRRHLAKAKGGDNWLELIHQVIRRGFSALHPLIL